MRRTSSCSASERNCALSAPAAAAAACAAALAPAPPATSTRLLTGAAAAAAATAAAAAAAPCALHGVSTLVDTPRAQRDIKIRLNMQLDDVYFALQNDKQVGPLLR